MNKDEIKMKIICFLLIASIVLVFCLTTVLNDKRNLTRQISSLSTQVEKLQENLKDTKYQNAKLKYELNNSNIVVDYVYSSDSLKNDKDLQIDFFVTKDGSLLPSDISYTPTENPEEFTSFVNDKSLCHLQLSVRNYTFHNVRLSYQFNNQEIVDFKEKYCSVDSLVLNGIKTRSLPNSYFGNNTKTVYTITLYFYEC